MNSSIPSIGIDIVDLDRFRGIAQNSRFLKKAFTSEEIRYCSKKSDPAPSLAGRFAAKEAVIKALSPLGKKIFFSEIEITSLSDGSVRASLSNCPDIRISLNLSHSKQSAVAVAIAYSLKRKFERRVNARGKNK